LVLVLPQWPQPRTSGQTSDSNHAVAASSVGRPRHSKRFGTAATQRRRSQLFSRVTKGRSTPLTSTRISISSCVSPAVPKADLIPPEGVLKVTNEQMGRHRLRSKGSRVRLGAGDSRAQLCSSGCDRHWAHAQPKRSRGQRLHGAPDNSHAPERDRSSSMQQLSGFGASRAIKLGQVWH